MNDYDDSEDYSSASSFRARSNTWPLNRPDLAVPDSVCIDETLPEIELEEDDLFTTNENWSTGLVDHDIMSWDPVLNAQSHHHHQHHLQNPQQQQQQQQHHQTATVHHHHQQQQQTQQQHQQLQQRQQPILYHQQHQQPHDNLIRGSTIILSGASTIHQQDQQLPPQSQQHQPHQALDSSHCLPDADDPSNEYHIQQLHHLHLDNTTTTPVTNTTTTNNNNTNQPQTDHQAHYITSLSSSAICIQQQQSSTGPNSASGLSGSNESYHNSSPSNHQHHPHLHHHHDHHHGLQPLTSAGYDLDQIHSDLDIKTSTLDNDHNNQHQHHQLHYLTSSSLDHHSTNTHGLLSSSLSTSGFGLSGDLEDLDYKAVDPSNILHNPQFEDQLQQQQSHLQGHTSGSDSGGASSVNNNCGGGNNNQSSLSTTSSKTKLNTPRRNAWGNMSYADLISQAINSTNDKRLTLSQIYDWMVQHVPYFKDKGDSNSSAGWKNSVRHNLSLHNRFKRLQNEGTGKSSWWTINPEANIGKCARRRAASMEASKYEKKRGRAKKRADAIRQGLVSYPSLTNSSLNGSSSALEQQPQIQSAQNQFEPQQQQQQQQPTSGLSSDSVITEQPSGSLYVASSQKSLYDDEDNDIQQQSRAPPSTTPPLQATSTPPPSLQQQQQQPESDCLFYCYTSHYIRPQANIRTDLTAD